MDIPRFNVIIATDLTGGFSCNNKLPWKFMKDTSFYNTITSSNSNHSSNILIMGRKTWESMNCRVPKNRIAFVVTSDYEKYTEQYKEHTKMNQNNQKQNLFFFPSFLDSLIGTKTFKDSIVWVIGGYQIYDEALNHPNCASIYCTKIASQFETDKKIDLNSYNIRWSNVYIENDINVYDNTNYILYFKKGFIDK